MKKVFIGLLFLFLDININEVTLLPPFVGYILILVGMGEERECPSRQTTNCIAAAGALVMGILWFWSLFGTGISLPIGMVFQLLITYRLVLWAEELTAGGESVEQFRQCWYVLTVGILLSLLGFFVSWLYLVALLISIGAAACYIYDYYQIWKELKRNDPQDGSDP